mmetsp:Transcript_7542/g.11501  ORF Transcript_7542/g.11501 Transcript_7542/m.11501 type:complete len:420 (+) Transcript_7542:249-1508(+)
MSSSPQRQREQGSPSKHGQGGGGGAGAAYPPTMYGGMHNPYGIKPDFDTSPQRYGGPPQGHPFPPQGYHHLAQHGGVGQFGQYNPYYGAYGGPPNGYFPPHHGADLGGRGGVGAYGGGGAGGHFPSPNRKHQPAHKASPPRTKENSTSSPPSKEEPAGKDLSLQEEKPGVTSGQDKSSPSSTKEENDQDIDQDELTSAVNPMRSDFHFFACDHKQETLDTLEKEMEKEDEKDKEKENDKKSSPFKTMTDLNERLLKMWEETPPRVRTLYMQKEESDRYRFMSEDEIASRHCATLTSRTSARKNPLSTVTNVVTKDEEDDSQEKTGSKRQSTETKSDKNEPTSEYESPTKKKKEDSASGEPDKEVKNTEQEESTDGVPPNELMKEAVKEDIIMKEDKPEETPKVEVEDMKSETKGDGVIS